MQLRWSFHMANLNDFIQVYDNILEEDICNYLINFFEQNPEIYEYGNDDFHTIINLTSVHHLSHELKEIHNNLIRKVFEYRDRYYEIFDSRVFPEKHAFEQFKIEKFTPNIEENYSTQVDVQDYSSARRYLCFMWYLNNNKGGQSEFLDFFIQPEKGKMVIYPPLWMFPYKKLEPIEEPQYILKTYLHYK